MPSCQLKDGPAARSGGERHGGGAIVAIERSRSAGCGLVASVSPKMIADIQYWNIKDTWNGKKLQSYLWADIFITLIGDVRRDWQGMAVKKRWIGLSHCWGGEGYRYGIIHSLLNSYFRDTLTASRQHPYERPWHTIMDARCSIDRT